MEQSNSRLAEEVNQPSAGVSDLDAPKTPNVDDALRPTHHLRHIKVGQRGVQLLVSTKDNLYDAENVDAGDESIQCIGAINDSSFGELARMVMAHQTVRAEGRPAGGDVASFHGDGRVLGGLNASTRRG